MNRCIWYMDFDYKKNSQKRIQNGEQENSKSNRPSDNEVIAIDVPIVDIYRKKMSVLESWWCSRYFFTFVMACACTAHIDQLYLNNNKKRKRKPSKFFYMFVNAPMWEPVRAHFYQTSDFHFIARVYTMILCFAMNLNWFYQSEPFACSQYIKKISEASEQNWNRWNENCIVLLFEENGVQATHDTNISLLQCINCLHFEWVLYVPLNVSLFVCHHCH